MFIPKSICYVIFGDNSVNYILYRKSEFLKTRKNIASTYLKAL